MQVFVRPVYFLGESKIFGHASETLKKRGGKQLSWDKITVEKGEKNGKKIPFHQKKRNCLDLSELIKIREENITIQRYTQMRKYHLLNLLFNQHSLLFTMHNS